MKLSLAELAKFDGREGRPAYVAFRGKIHDVSGSFVWRNGRHQAMHEAGADLTEALAQAPHGEDLLQRFPIVGTLAE